MQDTSLSGHALSHKYTNAKVSMARDLLFAQVLTNTHARTSPNTSAPMHSQARGLGSKRQSFDWLHIAPPTLPRKTTLRIINSPNSKSRLETPFDNAKSEVEDVQKLRELDDTLVYEFQVSTPGIRHRNTFAYPHGAL